MLSFIKVQVITENKNFLLFPKKPSRNTMRYLFLMLVQIFALSSLPKYFIQNNSFNIHNLTIER